MRASLTALIPVFVVSWFTASSAIAKNSDWDILGCGIRHCGVQLLKCATEKECRDTLQCNKRCGGAGSKADQQACHLVCQLELGKKSQNYPELVSCFGENSCLPKLPEGSDGICPVNESNIGEVHVLNDISEIEGTWREVRGLNCGQAGSGWEGGYDALPCRSSSWIVQDQKWWYHTSFCKPGVNNDCARSKPAYLLARPEISEEIPGLIKFHYVDPPLKPQEEQWYVLSKPSSDWMMYTYCGSTPAGRYAGLNVITKDNASNQSNAIPRRVERELRRVAKRFDINFDQLCENRHNGCPAITARDDIARDTQGLSCQYGASF